VRGACEGICTIKYPKELYLQRTDRTFAKIAGAWGADDPHGRGRDAIALDFDHDGDADLLVGNEKSTAFPTVGNHLCRNDGGRFVEVTGTPLAHTIGTFRFAAVPKPSSYPDVVMRTQTGVIYYRNNDKPKPLTNFLAGKTLGGSDAWDAEAADLNGDGLADLVIVRATSVEVRLNDGTFSFGTISYRTALTQGRDIALCQLDGTPGIDIYVVQGLRPTHQDIVLLNSGTGKSFTKLATPKSLKGHGDVATCLPGYPGALGDAVIVTNNKWISAGDPKLGPSRLMILK
jgi:hypothetical protein